MTNKDSTPYANVIPSHGGYRELKSYQNAEIVYDGTVKFCDKFIDRRSRTVDQMVQAARSGKQNIAEGSMASGTSKKTELKLVGVARASRRSSCSTSKTFYASANWQSGRRVIR
jgi:restriction system protein